MANRKHGVTDSQIIDAYIRLKAGLKVAAELRVAEQTVYGVLRNYGIKATGHIELHKRLRKFDEATSKAVLNAYKSGTSALQVAKQFGCSTETVLNMLRAAGVPIRWTQAQSKLSTDEQEKIKELYRSGRLSMKTIGDMVGRTEVAVRRVLLKADMGRPKVGPGSSHWKTGRGKDGSGYTYVWIAPDDPMISMVGRKSGASHYVYEHRLIMARKLGRPLLKTETVHHIDGNRLNNAPDNLQLRQGKHGKHTAMCCLDCGSHNIGHTILN